MRHTRSTDSKSIVLFKRILVSALFGAVLFGVSAHQKNYRNTRESKIDINVYPGGGVRCERFTVYEPSVGGKDFAMEGRIDFPTEAPFLKGDVEGFSGFASGTEKGRKASFSVCISADPNSTPGIYLVAARLWNSMSSSDSKRVGVYRVRIQKP